MRIEVREDNGPLKRITCSKEGKTDIILAFYNVDPFVEFDLELKTPHEYRDVTETIKAKFDRSPDNALRFLSELRDNEYRLLNRTEE